MAVAVVERFKQESMYGLFAGTKTSGRCGEVPVSGSSTVLSFIQLGCLFSATATDDPAALIFLRICS